MIYPSSGNMYNSYFKQEKKGMMFFPLHCKKVILKSILSNPYLVLYNHFPLSEDHLER